MAKDRRHEEVGDPALEFSTAAGTAALTVMGGLLLGPFGALAGLFIGRSCRKESFESLSTRADELAGDHPDRAATAWKNHRYPGEHSLEWEIEFDGPWGSPATKTYKYTIDTDEIMRRLNESERDNSLPLSETLGDIFDFDEEPP